MIDLYLKAVDLTSLKQGLPFLEEEAGKIVCYTDKYALDILGILYTKDTDGKTATGFTATALPGFHANLRCSAELIADIASEIIIEPPTMPRRKWM